MYTLLDSCLDRLDIFEFLNHVEDGLKDHYDIKVCCFQFFFIFDQLIVIGRFYGNAWHYSGIFGSTYSHFIQEKQFLPCEFYSETTISIRSKIVGRRISGWHVVCVLHHFLRI